MQSSTTLTAVSSVSTITRMSHILLSLWQEDVEQRSDIHNVLKICECVCRARTHAQMI